MENISNVATPDVAFVRTVNKAEGADGLVMAEMHDRHFTELTFTSPKKGGTLSPEAWETFRQVVANDAKDKHKNPLLTKAEKAAFKLDNNAFGPLRKSVPSLYSLPCKPIGQPRDKRSALGSALASPKPPKSMP